MAVRAPHVVKTRSGFLVLRVFQMIFALMFLGGCAYGTMKMSLTGFHLGIVTGAATLISLIYIVSATFHPAIYNYWAILTLELFCFFFWIVAIAVLGYDIVVISPYVEAWSYSSSYSYSYSYYPNTSEEDDWIAPIFIDICALIGVGGLEFIFFIISLSMFGVALAHHREARREEAAAGAGHPAYYNQDFGAEKNAVKAPVQAFQVGVDSSRSSTPLQTGNAPYRQTQPVAYQHRS